MVTLFMTSNFSSQYIRLRNLDSLVGTKVSVKNLSVQTHLKSDYYYDSMPMKVIDMIMLTRIGQRGSLRGTSLSIFQQEYHSESFEKSPTDPAHDQLSGHHLAGVVDLSHEGVEEADLVLTFESPISKLGEKVKRVGRKAMNTGVAFKRYRALYR